VYDLIAYLAFSAFENCRNTAFHRFKHLALRLVKLRFACALAPCLAKIFFGKTVEGIFDRFDLRYNLLSKHFPVFEGIRENVKAA
jgi:hypothetical protein